MKITFLNIPVHLEGLEWKESARGNIYGFPALIAGCHCRKMYIFPPLDFPQISVKWLQVIELSVVSLICKTGEKFIWFSLSTYW